MFDSLINSKFYNKCKHAFKCIRTRLVPIRRKKQAMIRFMTKDVAELLNNGLDTHAFGRMDGLLIEMNHADCYDMIEQYCDYIGKQLNSLQKQRDCPQETREAVSTLIFAAARFPDLPELCDLRHIFTERYGNFLEPFVSLEFVRKLDSELFTNEEKFQVMQSIAEESSVGFDTKALEIKLLAAPETKYDLLEKDSVKQVDLAMPLSNKQKEDEDAPCGRKSEAVKQVDLAMPWSNKQKEDEDAPHERKSEAVKQVDLAMPWSNKQKEDEDAPRERKSEATPAGRKQKLEARLNPKDVQDIQAVVNGIGRLNDNTRMQHSDKSEDKEHLEKSVSPLDRKTGNSKKEVQKASKKGVRPCENELMEAVELDLNGLPKQGFGLVEFPETEQNKIAPPIAKPKEAKKEHGVEKENHKGLGYHKRSHTPGCHDRSRRHANIGFKALGLQNEGPSSVNPSSGKATNRVPPYAKPNGTKGKNCAEKGENNSFLHDRPQHLADLGPGVQDGQRVPERAANMQPPYVKPKFRSQPLNGDLEKRTASDYSKQNITEQADHLADKDVLRPVSVRRKKPSAPVYAYDEIPNNGKVTSRMPSSHRRQSSKQKVANDDYDRKGNCADDGVDNGKIAQRTASGRPRHSSRRNQALYNDDDGFMQRHQAGEDDTAIDFGSLLPRTANGHRRLKSRNTNVHDRDLDEEERMMDKLLMHYSKKGLDKNEFKPRTGTNRTANGHGAQAQCQQNGSMHPPGRAVSLPPEAVSPEKAVKVPARSTSLQPACPGSVRVHPKMLDFDELAARVIALRNA